MEPVLASLSGCKRIVSELSPTGFGFLRSNLFIRGVARDILLFKSYLPTGSSVLDIGCGLGYITAALSSLGYSCTGIDLPPSILDPDFQKETQRPICWRIFQQQYGASYAYSNGRNIPFKTGSIDAVIMHGVLEHIQDDDTVQKLIADIYRILREKGYFFIFRCPRNLALTERIAPIFRIPHHEKLISEKGIVKALEKHFVIELIDRTDTLPQHFPRPFQNICNILTPILYRVQCMLDRSVFNLLSHHTRVVGVRK